MRRWHPFLVVLVALAALAACRDEPDATMGPITTARVAAVARCRESLGDLPAYARACKDLYADRACHDAIGALPDTAPAARLATVARACSNAYCEAFMTPRPKLCAIPGDLGELSPAELAAGWTELDARILSRDLGSAVDAPTVAVLAGALAPLVAQNP